MDVGTIRQALHRKPFRMFTLRLLDEREVFVPHPDFVAISPRQVFVINSVDELISFLNPVQILSLDYHAETDPNSA